jgi:hypothetical protein
MIVHLKLPLTMNYRRELTAVIHHQITLIEYSSIVPNNVSLYRSLSTLPRRRTVTDMVFSRFGNLVARYQRRPRQRERKGGGGGVHANQIPKTQNVQIRPLGPWAQSPDPLS